MFPRESSENNIYPVPENIKSVASGTVAASWLKRIPAMFGQVIAIEPIYAGS